MLHGRLERDMREEMSLQVKRATERLMARGPSRGEARRAALREFGNVHYLEEQARDVRGARWLGTLSPDAKLAIRMLVKNPLLSVVGGLGMRSRVVTAEYIRGDTDETTLYDYSIWEPTRQTES